MTTDNGQKPRTSRWAIATLMLCISGVATLVLMMVWAHAGSLELCCANTATTILVRTSCLLSAATAITAFLSLIAIDFFAPQVKGDTLAWIAGIVGLI